MHPIKSIDNNNLTKWHVCCHVHAGTPLWQTKGRVGDLTLEGGGGSDQMVVLQKGSRDQSGLTTLRGLLVPASWDERGVINSATVLTYFEEDYLIDQNPLGEELLAFVRQRVKVIGVVREDQNGNKIITVKKYEILDD